MKKLIIACIINTFLVILAGSVVRTTGAGMGCPDWPKCFGQLPPPTDSIGLPTNYKDIYIAKRIQKNEKLAHYLNLAGFKDLAYLIVHDSAVKTETEFNVTKAWIEYVNRLFGALLGVLLILLVFATYRKRTVYKSLFRLSIIVLLVTIFQGWLGSIVVSTHLLPGTITLHFLLTFIILGILLKMLSIVSPRQITGSFSMKLLCVFALILSLGQILLGTEVRKEIDSISYHYQYNFRETWIAKLDWKFYVHRSFSLAVLAINGYLFWKIKDQLTRWVMYFIGVEVLSGIVLAYFDFPALMQPAHIILASAMLGLQILLLFRIKTSI